MTVILDALTSVVDVLTPVIQAWDSEAEVVRGFVDGHVKRKNLPKVWIFPDSSTVNPALARHNEVGMVLVACVARDELEIDNLLTLEQACIDGLVSPSAKGELHQKGLKFKSLGQTEYIPPEVQQDALCFVFNFTVAVASRKRS